MVLEKIKSEHPEILIEEAVQEITDVKVADSGSEPSAL